MLVPSSSSSSKNRYVSINENEENPMNFQEMNNYTLIPISTVDCSNCGANCHTCYRSPWFELHFIYFSNELNETGFGIFYIYPYNQTFVQLNYTLTASSLSTPALTYNANWGGKLNGLKKSSKISRIDYRWLEVEEAKEDEEEIEEEGEIEEIEEEEGEIEEIQME